MSGLLKSLWLLSFCLLAINVQADSWQDQVIKICDDDAEWPPMTYYQRESGNKTEKLVGASVELITHIFNKHNINYQLKLLPWQRCLYEVEHGKNYQLILNAVSNNERRNKYLLTVPHFETEKHYFYNKLKYPKGLPINSVSDLKQYRLGGVRGYDHSVYGVAEEQIGYRTKSYANLIEMLYLDRFDIFLAGEGIVPWYRLTRPDLSVATKLGYAEIAELSNSHYHMLISKNFPDADALKKLIDDELALMRESGELQVLKDKYFN